jgi:hypothetical protein
MNFGSQRYVRGPGPRWDSSNRGRRAGHAHALR